MLPCASACAADLIANIALELAPCLVGALLLRPRGDDASPPRGDARPAAGAVSAPAAALVRRGRRRRAARAIRAVQSAPPQPATELTQNPRRDRADAGAQPFFVVAAAPGSRARSSD